MATPKNRSVLKAFKILRSFRGTNEWATAAELSRRAGLPEASGHRLILTLESLGAVVRDKRGHYRLGMLLLDLAGLITRHETLCQAAEPLLRQLARAYNLTAHAGVLEGGMVTYVAKAESRTGFRVNTRLGTQFEAYCSGLGKVLLADLPDEVLDAYLTEGELVPLTPHTMTDPDELRAELGRVRAQGFALDDREHAENMRCLAVPVRDSHGRAVAAISVSDAATRMTAERQTEIRPVLEHHAQSISRKLYPGQPEPSALGPDH